jgi:FtsH-binding integral membrane protein
MNPNQSIERVEVIRTADPSQVREFFQKVYTWMCAGLIISGITAYMVSNNEAWANFFLGNQITFIITLLIELGLVIWLSAGINKMSAQNAIVSFLVYCFTSGLTLSIIFLAYTAESINTVFFITAGMFGIISLYGYTTKADLSRTGQIAFMGLIGIILASVVNMFMNNPQVDYIISIVGVLIFTALTAYDTQKIKRFALNTSEGSEQQSKASIIGALTLYLDFINLFLMLLRLMGRRK